MRIIQHAVNHAATEEEIAILEQRLSCHLPDDYRRFLLVENGGKPDLPVGYYRDNDQVKDFSIRYFLALSSEPSNYTLQHALNVYSRRIPARYIPIACDSFGNLMLIAVREPDIGMIAFWDHEQEFDDEIEDAPCVHSVAKSFTSFVDTLTDR